MKYQHPRTDPLTYDGEGNRASKTVGATATHYLLDDRNPSGYVQVLEEYQGSSLSRIYNYGMALEYQSASTECFHQLFHLRRARFDADTDGHWRRRGERVCL